MIILADNDILLKLACCDLFDEFLSTFNVAHVDIRILKTARFALRSSKHQKQIGETSFARLTAFLSSVADIDVEPDPKAIAALTEQADRNIDAGEAVLFVVCQQIAGSIIVTGDKKSLVGLNEAAATDAACQSIIQTIAGRVVCFEQILVQILNRFGFDAVRQKLINGRESDRALAIWLGSGFDANEVAFREAVGSYLANIRSRSGQLLA